MKEMSEDPKSFSFFVVPTDSHLTARRPRRRRRRRKARGVRARNSRSSVSVCEARRWDRGGCAWAWDWPGSMRTWQGEKEKDEE